MEQKIKSIEVGWGDNSTFYSISEMVASDCKVDEIREDVKTIGVGYYNDVTLTVYRGYRGEDIVFEIDANCGVTLRYE